jgi:hypothetical protein
MCPENRAAKSIIRNLDLEFGFFSLHTYEFKYDVLILSFVRWFNLPAAPHQRGGRPETLLLHRGERCQVGDGPDRAVILCSVV